MRCNECKNVVIWAQAKEQSAKQWRSPVVERYAAVLADEFPDFSLLLLLGESFEIVHRKRNTAAISR
jgi:hypothetical protein